VVPVVDLSRRGRDHLDAFQAAVARVVRSGHVLLGPELDALESELAAWAGTRHAVGLGSGAGALQLGLGALGIGPGDEVIVPAFTAVPTASAVCAVGAVPVPVDVEPATGALDAGAARAAVTDRTKAVVPVHLYGRPAVLEDLGVAVLEDAAQAHGARVGSRNAGTFGDAAGFSFYPAKNLGAMGDAGCVTTDDASLAERVRLLGNYGATRKYIHDFRGSNSRIDELQAACLRVKLRYLDSDNAHRRKIAGRYCSEIAHPLVMTPTLPSDPDSHVWHLFVVKTPHRSSLVQHLEAHGIETLIHYPSVIHQQLAYLGCVDGASAPVAEHLQHQVLSLPISPVLESDQVDHVIDAVNRWPGPR